MSTAAVGSYVCSNREEVRYNCSDECEGLDTMEPDSRQDGAHRDRQHLVTAWTVRPSRTMKMSVILGFAAITALVFWPVITDIAGSLCGYQAGDNTPILCLSEWIGSALTDGGALFYCPLFNYPFGTNLGSYDSWLMPLVFGPFWHSEHFVLCYNVSTILCFIFSLWACWLLGLAVTGQNRWGGFVFTAVCSLNSFVGSTIYFDNNGYNLLFGWMAMCVLAALKGVHAEKSSRRALWAAASGMCWFLSFLTTAYFGMILFMAGCVIFLYALIARPVPVKKLVLFSVQAAGISILLAGLFAMMVINSQQGELLLKSGTKARQDVRVIVKDFFTNNSYSFFKARYLPSLKKQTKTGKPAHTSIIEVLGTSFFSLVSPWALAKSRNYYLGVFILLLILLSLRPRSPSNTPAWILGTFFFFLGMGPMVIAGKVLPFSPWALATLLIPGFTFFSMPYKFFLPAFMCFGVIGARAAAQGISSQNRLVRRLAIVLPLLIVLDLLFWNFSFRWNSYRVVIPDAYRQLGQEPDPGVLFDLYPYTAELELKDRALLYRNIHRKAILEPISIHGLLYPHLPRRLMMGLLSERLAATIPGKESSSVLNPDAYRKILKQFGITHIMFHQKRFPGYLRQKIENLLSTDFGPPILATDEHMLFRTGVHLNEAQFAAMTTGRQWQLTPEDMARLVRAAGSYAEFAGALLKSP